MPSRQHRVGDRGVEPLARDHDALILEEPEHALLPGEPVGVERSAEVEQHRRGRVCVHRESARERSPLGNDLILLVLSVNSPLEIPRKFRDEIPRFA